MLKRARKAVGALLGGATGAVVVSIADAIGWELTPGVAGAIAVLLATAGAWLAPPNETG